MSRNELRDIFRVDLHTNLEKLTQLRTRVAKHLSSFPKQVHFIQPFPPNKSMERVREKGLIL